MPPKLIVEVVGDTRQLQKSFERAQKQTRGFGRDMEKAGRGATVAALGFRGLGRSVAFAGGAFLGGVGVVAGIKSTIAAAEESQRVLGQTQVAVQRSGLSWAQYGDKIQKAALAQANLSGFDDERLLGTFSALVRRTGDVNRALTLNALAADVARARNIELEQAAQLVLKASLGQAGALRRVGIQAKAGATGLQLIDSLQRKFAGSAEAYGKTAVGAQDRFRVAVQNTQEAIGSALLPALTHVLDKASLWLSDTKRQEAIQRDLNTAIRDTGTALKVLRDGIDIVTGAYKGLRSAAESQGTPGKAIFEALFTPKLTIKALETIKDRIDGVTSSVKTLQSVPAFGSTSAIGQLLSLAPKQTAKVVDPFADARPNPRANIPLAPRKNLPLNRNQRTTIALARAQSQGNTAVIVAAANARLAFLRDTVKFAQNLIRQHRGNTAQLSSTLQSLFGEEASVEGIITGIQDDAANKAKAIRDKREAKEKARAKAAEAARKASLKRAADRVAAINKAARAQVARLAAIGPNLKRAEAARQQRQQFIALGLTATGEDLAPSRKALQASLKQVEKNLAGTILDTDKNRNLIARIRKVLSGQFGALTRETKLQIKRLEDALTGGDKRAGPLTKFHTLDVSKITRGLDRQTALTIQARLSRAHIVVDAPIHLDGRVIARSVTSHQVQRNNREPTQTRGRQTR